MHPLKGQLIKKPLLAVWKQHWANKIADKLNEWEYQDSAGYSLPNQARPAGIWNHQGKADIDVTRFSSYIRIIYFDKLAGFTLQAGSVTTITLNKEFLYRPAQASVLHQKMETGRDI
jgi:hypothetical protein